MYFFITDDLYFEFLYRSMCKAGTIETLIRSGSGGRNAIDTLSFLVEVPGSRDLIS